MIIIKVVLPIPIRKYFEYFLPNFMCPVIGGRVLVPFNSKDLVGIVISFYKKNNISQLNFKYVKLLIDKKSLFSNITLDLIKWTSKNYYCPMGNLFFSILPKILHASNVIKNIDTFQWIITQKGRELDLSHLKNRKKQLETLLFLKKKNILNTELKKYNLSQVILKKLEIQELCVKYFDYRIFFKKKFLKIKRNFFLNKKISIILDNILIKKSFSSWLLSENNLYAKVKFYLGLIKSVLYKSMQILILVPYIKNINIILVFLKKYFNVSIDIIHSKLANTKYFKNWIRTKNGENSIIIGTRKSIFLPFSNLGVIIIFEEHNLRYKSIYQCRYNVRDLGILRAYKENIPIILDSNTPSLKTLYNVLHKKCFYIKLYKHNYINKLNNSIIDLKKDKIKFGLSLTLINEIYKNSQKKQVLLIFNKFNLFFFVLKCSKCNFIFECSSCHNYLEINEYRNILFCKFCLIQIKKPIFCSNCRSFLLLIIKISIEKIENKIQNLFPKIPLFFLLNEKNINKNILNKKNFEFYISSPYIIITTEEIVQNYYFPHIKLIVLMCIDNYFLSFNFRAIEYFAQFYINLNQLTKSIKKSFKIFIQTSFPNDINLKEICNNGYFSFSRKILSIRKNFLLPPWNFHSVVYSESLYAEYNIIFLNLIRKILEKKSNKNNFFLRFVGPHNSFLSKNKKKHFHKLLIECSSRIFLKIILNECIDLINIFDISKRVKWFIDVEPN
ncbi:primosomal protein N' [Buchnera aphidicola (Acyrthosiphon lactucae)]|uniref:Replication restart protein PriA n=1 Tax=Buchnera aphidicola (Acyrthosiphon lactucae) TaxID=1241832 RepID=A0A4D6XSU3_9GAMM|nr:primosomal protein N' [Buchnera aphidicola]QCI17530.1 primosomal protein N' [Buchnera aphidicola (Acyrthosiphon lactucae)]